MTSDPQRLPYVDAKPVGAADFYFAINATFRFVFARFGIDGLRRYWTDLGKQYFSPVSADWRRDGLRGIAEYWQAFFAAEPGAEVQVRCDQATVVVDVQTCPAFKHLREHGREILPCFCQHCYFISQAMAEEAGFTVRVNGGNGVCQQTFLPADTLQPPQDLSDIRTATC